MKIQTPILIFFIIFFSIIQCKQKDYESKKNNISALSSTNNSIQEKDDKIENSSPVETIINYHTYLENKDLKKVNEVFNSGNYSKNSLGRSWLKYEIEEINYFDRNDVENFKKILQSNSDEYQGDEDEYIDTRDPIVGDVSVIVVKTITNSNNRERDFRFWYLLRKYEDGWKIISHTATDD